MQTRSDADSALPATDTPLELLADELGAVAGRIEREVRQQVALELERLGRSYAEAMLRVRDLEARLAQENFEDIDRPVLQRHGGSHPIGRRGLVGHGVDRNSFDVLCQPERPEGIVIRRSSPSIVSVAAEAMDENDARSRRPSPAGNFD